MNYLLTLIAVVGFSLPTYLGYNLVFGRAKILHFGPTGTSLVTSYSIFIVERATDSFMLGLLAGLVAGFLISAFFAWLALRLEGDSLGILTIAVHLALLAVVLNWDSVTRGAFGIPNIPRFPGLETLPAFAAFSVFIAVVWVWILWKVDHSWIGRSLAALAEHRIHAEALGINRAKMVFIAFMIAGLGSFLSGMLYPQYLGLLHPNDYGFRFLIYYLMCVVAGGPGNVLGVALSTSLILILQEGLRFAPLPLGVLGPLRLVLFGVILIVAVYARRKELFPQPRTI